MFQPEIGSFLGAPIHARDQHVGSIYIGEKSDGGEFTEDDEETLAIFASQAAMAITNARRYGDEQRAKADLEALVNTSPVGVLVFDALTRRIVSCNQEARRLIGAPRGESPDADQYLDRVSYRRVDGQIIPRDDLPLERVLRDGEQVRAEEIVFALPGDSAVTTLVNGTPIRNDSGEVVSAVITLQDITPLEELERMRAEFLGMVSHELRSPLATIKGSTSTVLGAAHPFDPAETRQFFSIIEEQAELMRDLISNLLDLSRIEAGTMQVAREPTSLAPLIEQAKRALASSGYQNTVEVQQPSDLPQIVADGQRVVQVLYNLLANAARNSPEWSSVRLTARQDGLDIVVMVEDEGRGIAPEHLNHLFSKFAQLDSENAMPVDGNGLGLAICKGIVEAHGGRIWAESEGYGRGARFTFTLPTVVEASAGSSEPLDATGEAESSKSHREHVLVVDDDPQILRFVRKELRASGYQATVTDDPGAVEALLRDHQPKLILLNLVLPGTDGFELIHEIRAISDAPVIFISGRGRGEDIAKAFQVGAADYVVKPFSSAELIARVESALRKQAMYEQSRALDPYVQGDLTINYLDHSVTLAGRHVTLTPTEFKLLAALAGDAGNVLSHEDLSRRLWPDGDGADQRLLRTFVKKLRSKLGDDARRPVYIFTKSREGYWMKPPQPYA